MPNPSTYPYRRFPTIQAGAADHAARGTDAVKQELHALCAGSSKTVVTVECYPGTDQAEILALFPHAELIIHADDLAIQPAELDAKIEHELTDDPVFGIQHKPGDAMQVDWAGETILLQDPVTGEQSAAYLFVAVLPCSYYTYAEACDDMKTENWLNCHVHAFDYFGGVARLLIPDNCKTATLSNTRYDVILNRSYQGLAEHYGTAIVPARVRKPRDKSSAEASVRFAETWIVAALRDRKFFSLRELNEAVAEKLAELNSRPFKQMAGCRRSAYLEEEKPYMLPLPASAYESAVWSVAKVANDYFVADGRNKYSVPYNLIGERVDIRVTKEVFYLGSRVASHRRLQTRQRDPLVKREHMPPEHQKYLTYNADEFSRWAMSVGPMTEKVADHFLKSGKAAEQGYKACADLSKLEQRYGKQRLEAACGKALVYSTAPALRTIASILKNGLDKPDKAESQLPQSKANSYGITRGAAYFRKGGDRGC